MSKDKKVFSMSNTFDKKVKRLTLTIQDVPIYESPENKDTLVGESATIFGTLQMFTDSKKTVKNINFTLPLTDNKDFKDHVLSMVQAAIDLHEKKK